MKTKIAIGDVLSVIHAGMLKQATVRKIGNPMRAMSMSSSPSAWAMMTLELADGTVVYAPAREDELA